MSLLGDAIGPHGGAPIDIDRLGHGDLDDWCNSTEEFRESARPPLVAPKEALSLLCKGKV